MSVEKDVAQMNLPSDDNKSPEACPVKNKEITFPELGHETLQDFIQVVYKDVVQTTICSNSLPVVTEDHGYWESFGDFKTFCRKEGTRILENIGNILQHSAVQCKWGTSHLSGKTNADIDDQFEKLVDANDILLENVGSLLDEAAGIKKKGEDPIIMTSSFKTNLPVVVSSWNKKKDFSNKGAPYKLLLAKNIHRPQLNWMDTIDNRNIPFVPHLKYKPNALKPLGNDFDASFDANQDDMPPSIHPYHYELSLFEPNDWQLEIQTPKMYAALDETSLTMVDNQELLDAMMNKLRQAKEIVVDLEHHNYRSFQGIVCLIQISTRKEDFIIDSLKLRGELSVLNDVFTNPAILKVLHGSDADIGWLQRDFGVYMVNMFDTGQAARMLQEARFSLAHLLQKYCNITAQKQYQLADWRIRPLPSEMIRYAREDTHYLLYVYDVLRNELIVRGNELRNLLRLVYTKSTDLCASLYKKPLCLDDSHMTIYAKYRKRFNPQQLECFRLIYQWRDKIARQEDESTGYVLPNHMLFQVAENLPKDPEGIIACCNPVPPLINQHVSEIVGFVSEARYHDPQEVPVTDKNSSALSKLEQITKDKDADKFKTGLFDPRTGFEIYSISGPKIQSKKPLVSLFEIMIKEHLEIDSGKKKATELMEILKSPFEMYLPNTDRSFVKPEVINETWKQKSKEKCVDVESYVARPSPSVLAEEFLPVSFSNTEKNKSNVIGKKKRRRHGLDDEEKTLREMLPKKVKMPKPLSEHLDDLVKDDINSDGPIQMDYQKNINCRKDFVPFDYSKADLKKFNAATSQSNSISNLDQVEEPNFKGPVKTKLASGARQMSF